MNFNEQVIQSHKGLIPVLFLRKHFKTDAPIKSAKLYATAQGVYQLLFNGKNISDYELSPGWTEYNKSIQYQSYDVTEMITKENVLGAVLGTGWFSGFVGFGHRAYYYGRDQHLLLELHIEYKNNTKVIIKTDDSWRVTTGPIIYSDLLMGQLYYESRQLNNWMKSSYEDKEWFPVVTKPINKTIQLIADRVQPVRVTQELKPISKWQSSPGVWVFDFGQNFVGWVRLRLSHIPTNTRVQLRHAEVLNPNGTVYTKNLRAARAIDTYVFNGK